MMRKYLIIAIIALVSTGQASAQSLGKRIKNGFKNTIDLLDQNVTATGTHGRWDFYITPKVGVAASNLTGMGGNIKLGFIGGFYTEVFILPNLAVDVEMTYSRQGTNSVTHVNNHGVGSVYNYRLDYINTDYFCRWYPYEKTPLSVYSGIQVSRLVKAKYVMNGEANSIRSNLRSGDVSIPVGVSYECGQWQADLRYNFGITRVPRNDLAKSIMGKAHCHTLALTLGYKIQVW